MSPPGEALAKNFATLGIVGYFPYAPGTMGTLAALLFLLATNLPPHVHLLVAAFCVLAGAYAAGRFEEAVGARDPQVVVIDEFAGYLLATAFLPGGAGWLVSSFILFRLFDILKPPPVNALQRLGGGLGIMADDVAAGIYANLVLQLWRFLART